MSRRERGSSCTFGSRPAAMTVRRAAVAVSVALLALGVAGCDKPSAEARGGAGVAPTAIPVVTQPARIEPMGIEIEAVGTTQANESVQVTSKASNTVIAIRFKEGEEVQGGAILVEMDASQAKAALAEAEA